MPDAAKPKECTIVVRLDACRVAVHSFDRRFRRRWGALVTAGRLHASRAAVRLLRALDQFV
jgi:hypothetical protein